MSEEQESSPQSEKESSMPGQGWKRGAKSDVLKQLGSLVRTKQGAQRILNSIGASSIKSNIQNIKDSNEKVKAIFNEIQEDPDFLVVIDYTKIKNYSANIVEIPLKTYEVKNKRDETSNEPVIRPFTMAKFVEVILSAVKQVGGFEFELDARSITADTKTNKVYIDSTKIS